MSSTDQDMENALAFLSQGNRNQALTLLARIAQIERTNEGAWLALGMVVEETTHCIKCLQHVLQINPDNSFAVEELKRMQSSNLGSQTRLVAMQSEKAWLALSKIVKTDTQRSICLRMAWALLQNNHQTLSTVEKTFSKSPVNPKAKTAVHTAKSRIQRVEMLASSTPSNPVLDFLAAPTVPERPHDLLPAPLFAVDTDTNRKKFKRVSKRKHVPSLRSLHKFFALLERLVFYSFLLSLPIDDLYVNLPIKGVSWILLSRLLIFLTLGLWLITQLINPHRKWLWGWWFVLIPVLYIGILKDPSVEKISLMILMYFFIINEIPEKSYWEVAVVFTASTTFQLGIVPTYGPWAPVLDGKNPADAIAVQSLISLGLPLASRKWYMQIAGGLIAVLVLATTIKIYHQPTTTIYLSVLTMLVFWMVARPRMTQQLFALFVVLFSVFAVLIFMGDLPRIDFSSAGMDIMKQLIAHGWLVAYLLLLPPCAALIGSYLKDFTPFFPLLFSLFFLATVIILGITYSAEVISFRTWFGWIVFFCVAVAIYVTKVFLTEGAVDLTQVYVSLFTWPITSAIFVLELFEHKGYTERKIGAALTLVFVLLLCTWLLKIPFKLISLFPIITALGLFYFFFIAGLIIAWLLRERLSVGCASFVVFFLLIVLAVLSIFEVANTGQKTWPLLLGVFIAISAWRSQRMWTLVFAASLIGIGLLNLDGPTLWLVNPQNFLLVIIVALWVDKSNIPSKV